jgi:fluoroacetyl-CoA thioesterase
MRETLKPGIRHEFTFVVPNTKTVPELYPESAEFQAMPRVFATGYLVGLIEWTCIQAIVPHIDWPREQTVGTHFELSHTAPTPPDCPVTVEVELVEVEKRRLRFRVSARDDVGTVSDGTHDRFVIDAERFNAKLSDRQRAAGS